MMRAAIAAAFAIALTGATRADPVTDFYKGQNVRIVNWAAAGGEYDIHGKLVSRHMGRFIPGNPTLLHMTMTGGGGLVAQMFAWNAVDQVLAFVAPKIIGGRFAPTPVGGEGKPFMAEAWRLKDVRHEVYGDDLAISGFL